MVDAPLLAEPLESEEDLHEDPREGRKRGATGSRARISGGKPTVTDGPFVETKELIAGFRILQAG